jgi:uncharacterized protein YsxB (DUF464 family)
VAVIHLRIMLRPDGCLEAFQASGHSTQGGRGKDIVCASVTVLLRTAGRLLEAEPGLQARGEAPEPGEMSLRLAQATEAQRDRIRGITDFLVRGLLDLRSEYPDIVSLEIRQKGSTEYGT